MADLIKLFRNTEQVKKAVRPGKSINRERVQKILQCGMGEAEETIRFGIDNISFKRDPNEPNKVIVLKSD